MLTDSKVKAARPKENRYYLTDSGGLQLRVNPTGDKKWCWRRAADGKEVREVIGSYPAMSLKEARDERDRLKGIAEMAQNSFREVALSWHSSQAGVWKASHSADVLRSLDNEIFPNLGGIPPAAIDAPMILAVLRPIQERGAIELAHRLRQRISAIFVFAIASGLARYNPAAGLEAALAPVIRQSHQPAALGLDDARSILEAAEAVSAHPVIKLAMRILALTALRPGEVRAGEWAEVTLDGPDPVWRIPAARMKHTRIRLIDKQPHLVPLSAQAVEAMRALMELSGASQFMFPMATNIRKHISENALSNLLKRAGLSGVHVPHGWRASFSTVMNDLNPVDAPIIDLMLAHTPKDKVQSAYNRAGHASRRRAIAQEWADLLLRDFPPAVILLEGPRRSCSNSPPLLV